MFELIYFLLRKKKRINLFPPRKKKRRIINLFLPYMVDILVDILFIIKTLFFLEIKVTSKDEIIFNI